MTDAEAAYYANWDAACDTYLRRVEDVHGRFKREEITRTATEVLLNANHFLWRSAQERLYDLLGEEKARCR